jgi:antitoxin CptB
MTTGSRLSSEGLDARRKRLLFRCWHRGTKELDLIVGRFADANLIGLTDAELDQFERILEAPDPDLYAAFTGEAEAPEGVAGTVFERIKSFRAASPSR